MPPTMFYSRTILIDDLLMEAGLSSDIPKS
jgi:hypothetical protein